MLHYCEWHSCFSYIIYKLVKLRAPGYTKFNTKSRGDGEFVHLEAVAVIRERVKAWRAAGWPGITPVTRQLLERWCGVGQEEGVVEPRPFFCQLEAIETLIWLTEGAEAERQGLWGMFEGQLQGDGGPFERVCTKLCTGDGKTKVMAMLIAWHACNKATYPHDKRFCRDFLIVAPNLTVRDRLAGLDPGAGGAEYDGCLVPTELEGALAQAHVRILNWQAMQWEDAAKIAKKRGVDKRGALSDRAYARAVLGAVVKHLLEHLSPKERRVLSVVRDSRMPTRSTAAMRTWHTTKEPRLTGPKSQIGAAVYDSTWEQTIAETLAGMAAVQAYVRNDRHVGLRVRYVSQGVARTYIPDFIVRFASGETVVLEVKGMDDATAQDKHNALKRWCAAVTSLHDFGTWRAAKVRAANKLALLAALGVPS